MNTVPDDLQIPPVRKDGLQLAEDRPLQRKLWRSERISWIAFGLILAGALAGVSGSGGYFSKQTILFGEATAQLPRIGRWQASDNLVLRLETGSSTQVVFGQRFVESFSIESVSPEPVRSSAGGSGLALDFDLTGEGPSMILIGLRPNRPGWISYQLAVAGERRTVQAIILP